MTDKVVTRIADAISIKGTKEGLVVAIGEGPWPDLVAQLEDDLQRKAAFFDGAHAILRVGTRELATEDLRQVQELLSANRMQMSGVVTSAEKTAEAATALDIPIALQSDDSWPVEAKAQHGEEPEEALFLKRTVRSGQTIQHPGHVTILGDVNPGGQVVAGGDVVIWGKLRGTVHAGAVGDDSSLVCALVLAPTQLRIGNHIARSPEEEPREPGVPEIARVQGDGIVVEPWSKNRP
jgi:septum site-determining protein MinC